MIFTHTSKEKDLWRGWLKNGQSVELSRDRYGWDFGAGVHIHSNDSDMGDRMLFLKFWRFTAVIPLGIIDHPWPSFDGPQWSVYAANDFGLSFRWGMKSKSFSWPWHRYVVAREHQMPDGSWEDASWKMGEERSEPYKETHSYIYVLKSGKAQMRTATVSKERFILTYRIFKRIGWPRWAKYNIEVEFDGEVGERSGSWKGGCVGCSYDMKKGETMLDTLRRMERERKFR